MTHGLYNYVTSHSGPPLSKKNHFSVSCIIQNYLELLQVILQHFCMPRPLTSLFRWVMGFSEPIIL